MTARSLFLVPVLALAAACGGSDQPPAVAPTAPPAAPPADTASPAPADTSAAADAGAATTATEAPPDASAAPAPVASVPAPAKPWAQMNHKERLELMKTVVLPNMKTAFQGFDAKDFADFNCTTCHGDRIKKGKFDMPNPGLPKLDFKNGLKDDMAKHPEVAKFMGEVVVPQMSTMLGVRPFDMKTMKGFGCAGCHTGK
jgi:hypothetical protein